MKITIANRDLYKSEIKAYFDKILDGRLLSICPNALNDESLFNKLSDFNINEDIHFNNFCTWLTIGETGSDNYNGHDFSFIYFYSNDDLAFSVNYSQFTYLMCPYNGSLFSAKYEDNKAKYTCLINGRQIDPKRFANYYKGKKILVTHWFDALNSFNRVKQCYFFSINQTPNTIRKHILLSQRFVLNSLLQSPARYAPCASLEFEFDDGRVNYLHNVTFGSDGFKDIQQLIEDIFIRDYKSIVISRLAEINRELFK